MTISAKSLSQTDVQAAIDKATPGDTVTLPAATATWTAGVKVTKSLTIQGQGPQATIIERDSATDPSYKGAFITLGPLEADEPIRLTGVGFDNRQLKPPGDLVCVYVAGTKGKTYGLTKIRVDHCSFNAGNRQLRINGYAYGVSDHCTFRNPWGMVVFPEGAGYEEWDRHERVTYGNFCAWYIEDCAVVCDEALDNFNGAYDCNFNSSAVWRRCSFDITNSSGAGIWNVHGNHKLWDPDARDSHLGSYRLEVYDCTITAPTAYRWGYCRGGRLLFTDNEFITLDGGNPPILGIAEEEGFRTDICDPPRTTWPGEAQINASFFWNNTCNGEPSSPPKGWNPTDGIFLQENRDYWLKAPNPSTTSFYPDFGEPSRPDNPYQIDTPTWPPCTSFTKAPYPHPLVTQEESAPTELVVTVIAPPEVRIVVQTSP